MPFDPIETDEKLSEAVKPKRDMDAAMLFGCSGFVVASVGGYLLSLWPFLVFQQTEQLRGLGIAGAAGLIPAAVLGMVCSRRFGLAGACGFVGGSMTTAIFLYLRIQQTFIGALARQAPKPDYPQMFMYLVPLGWTLVSVILALLLLPSEKNIE